MPLVVVLSTTGKTPVSLAATCPDDVVNAQIHTEYTSEHNNFGWTTAGAGDICSTRVVVEPGKPVTLSGDVPTDTQGATWWPGSTVSVQWSMAGVSASASATVR